MSKKSGVPGKTPDQLRRFEDAMARQAERDARSAAEQLKLLDDRPGESKREKERLDARDSTADS